MGKSKREIKKKNKTLIGKIANACVVLGLFSIMLSGTVLGINYYNHSLERYGDTTYSICNSVAHYLDGDKVEEYSITHRTDEYYDEMLKYIDTTADYLDVKYLYVFVPMEDELMSIFDHYDVDGTRVLLGQTEDYTSDMDKDTLPKVLDGTIKDKVFYSTFDSEFGYLACAYAPVLNSKGKPVAVVGVEVDMTEIVERIMAFISSIIVVMIVTTLLLLSPFYYMIKRNVIVPIEKVSQAASTMLEHITDEDEFHMDIHTGDEIEELAESFEKMDAELKQYIRELSLMTSEKERIGTELNIAARIQTAMLPKQFPDTEEIEIFASMLPAKEVGGDFYDVFMVDDTHLAIIVADVSGKGVPAALFMAISKTLIWERTLAEKDPAKVFAFVNNALCGENNSEGMFVTAFEGILDLCTGELTYVNAGHEPPFIMKKDGSFEAYKISPSLVLGAMEDMPYTSGSIVLEPGDRLFQYTDGVTEATNWKNEQFELRRLHDSLNRHKDELPEVLARSIKKDIDRFVGEADQFDDMTMICLDFKMKKVVVGQGAETDGEASKTEKGEEANSDISVKYENEEEIKKDFSTILFNKYDVS